MTKTKSILFLILLLGLSQFTLAGETGGWSSSGGESLIYARNPWFVKNTTKVEYCILIEAPSFSASKAQIESSIEQAFKYWKQEFETNNEFKAGPAGYAKIATQDFKYLSSCSQDTPLVFKFGIKSLDADEVKYLDNPKKFIGVTIRKNYSLEQMQGSGSIYISADKGQDAYANNGQLINEAWRSPILLQYAIIHELGHFFGIPHIGSGIMSEVFMSVLLNKKMTRDFEESAQLSFLNPQKNFEVCRSNNFFNPDFFGIAKGSACLKFEIISGQNLKWNVSSKSDSDQAYELIGTAQVNSLDQSPYSLKPAVIVQLPDEQKVFSALETIIGPFLVGATFSDISYNGSYRPINGVRAFPIQMSLSAEKISFVGSIQNQQMTLLNYSPLSFMKVILP